MLEILYTDDGTIVVAKKKPCVWGSSETNVVDLEDDALEASMGSHYMVTYPYRIQSRYIVDTETVGEDPITKEDLIDTVV